jgi:PAS domain S-box-containing protein
LSIYYRDITERKRAEETLRESEERYRKLFDSIDEGFAIIEMLYGEQDRAVDYRILETNPAFGRMTGFADAAGKTSLELNPGAEANWFETLGRVAETGEDVRFESYAEALDRWFDVYASRVGGEGSRRVAIVFADTTERKRAEEKRDRLRAREIEARTQKEERRRIARDLHDVVLQDLAGVLQSLRLVYLQSKGSGLGLDFKEELEALGRATLGLRGAVHDLRGEKERPLVKSVESLVELNRRLAPDCNIELIIEEGFPNRLRGEVGGELLRVIREALTNARHHSGAKSAAVTLKVQGSDLVAEISDDGQGFALEGTLGVGLSSMQERAANVDGRLEIESELGQGTSVRLLVPVPQIG